MFSHPMVREVDDNSGSQYDRNVAHTERCTDCHSGEPHGRMSAFPDRRRSAYGDWYDYDPFWRYGSYYDPWLWGSSSYSPYFYDGYYGYRSVPWWLYNAPVRDEAPDLENPQSPREKPLRRGNAGSDAGRKDITPAPSVPRPSSGGVEKPSPSSSGSSSGSNGSSGGSDSEKEKPARRGGVK